MARLEWREKVCESGMVGIWSGSIVRDSQLYDSMEGQAWRRVQSGCHRNKWYFMKKKQYTWRDMIHQLILKVSNYHKLLLIYMYFWETIRAKCINSVLKINRMETYFSNAVLSDEYTWWHRY